MTRRGRLRAAWATATVAAVVGTSLIAPGVTLLPGVSVAAADESAPAFDVTDFGATADDDTDDTAAFGAAIAAAGAATPGDVRQWADGPDGAPQSVVVVPGGTYRLFGLRFVDNVRLEVDAAAVLEPTAEATSGPGIDPVMISWDTKPDGQPLRNVSLVGTGSASSAAKAAAPLPATWNADGAFTVNLDPAVIGSGNRVGAMTLANVTGFLVAHVLAIQNDSRNAGTAITWPMTRRSAFVLRSRSDTPIGGPYADPHHGTVDDVTAVHEPRGFGPIQVNSAHDVTITRVRSRGGTALRLETDGADGAFGAEIDGVTAETIEGVDCNRALSWAPHRQFNHNVTVRGVRAIGCNQGVIEALDERIPADQRGAFLNSTVNDVYVEGGLAAQLPDPTGSAAWSVGRSMQVVSHDPWLNWAVTYHQLTCAGLFTVDPDRVLTEQGWWIPPCGPSFGPRVRKVTPYAVTAGASQAEVTLLGRSFDSETTVSIDGDGVTVVGVSVINAKSLAVILSVDPSATPGPRTVTVANPVSSHSCSGCLTINPLPTVDSIDESPLTRGVSTTLTIRGSNFLATPRVRISGSRVIVGNATFIDASTLRVPVTVQPTAARGTRTVTVTNPGGGSGSCSCLVIGP